MALKLPIFLRSICLYLLVLRFLSFGLVALFMGIIGSNDAFSAQSEEHKNQISPKKAPLITITQITEHPSLDKIRNGIVETLQKAIPDVDIRFDNAQGNIATASLIAAKTLALNPDLAIAITTPSAQTMAKVLSNSQIPIVFSAVTDPLGVQLLNSLDMPKGKITGVVDQPPIGQALDVIKALQPRITAVGVLYNSGEANSAYQLQQIKFAAESRDINVIEVAVSSASDISLTISLLLESVDAILLPNDNLIISSLEPIIKSARVKKVPVYTSDPESLTRGATAAIAFDQHEIGVVTGNLALTYLAHPENTPKPVLLKAAKLYLNLPEIKRLDLNFNAVKDVGLEIVSSF